jgi:hypothetical protein
MLVAVGLLTATAFWIRWILATTGGYWRDEGLAVFVIKLPTWSAMLEFLRFHESHPPLFYVFMRLWISIFGDSDRMSILPAVILGAALIPAIFVVGRSLFSQRVAVIAAALAAFSPALVEHAATTRPYSLLPLLTLVSVYALIQATHHFSIRTWAVYGASTIALLYTHNWAWLVLFGEWVGVLVTVGFHSHHRKRIIRDWAIAQAAIALVYAPWLTTFIYQGMHAGHSPSEIDISSDFLFALVVDSRRFLESTILGHGQTLARHIENFFPWVFSLPLLMLMVVHFLFVVVGSRQQSSKSEDAEVQSIAMRYLVIIPIAAFVVALGLSPRTELMLPRCLAAVAPLLLLAMASWLARPRKRWLEALGTLTIAVFIATYLLSVARLLPTARSNARELALAMANRTRSTDLIVVAPDWLASSFNRYYEPNVEQIDYPEFSRQGAIDFARSLQRYRNEASLMRARRTFQTAREEKRRVWLVVDVRKFRPMMPKRLHEMETSNSYGLVSFARSVQLRLSLDSLYGPPDTVVVDGGRVQRYEYLTALLYSPK